MTNFLNYIHARPKYKILPNRWDVIALVLVLGLVSILGYAAMQMAVPYHVGQVLPISLSPTVLPRYALQTVLRMIIAMLFSLLFTFIFATWAAKSRRAEKIIIPLIDILQSLPVLAFLSVTIVGFIRLFPGSLLGPECAAIFATFTSQAWNIALSFYQSLKTVPTELQEAADVFHLSAWQRFWRVEVPFAMPPLLWNAMMSMSASWFFVVTSEAISVSNQKIALPGIGSYIARAVELANTDAVIYAIVTMLLVIILYDQLLFRPLIKWSEKFKVEQTIGERSSRPWVTSLLHRTYILRYCGQLFEIISDAFINLTFFKRRTQSSEVVLSPWLSKGLEISWTITLATLVAGSLFILGQFILATLPFSEVIHVTFLGVLTAVRIFVLIIICSLIWVPVGVWIGFRPSVAEFVQPITQVLAAFPAYLLFPVVVMVIVKYHLNVEIWVAPLMVLGTQWYILFNVIAGASALPKELNEVTNNFGVKRWLWWRRLILPAIFPYYITGAVTAVGGAWNASIVAEVVPWGDTTLKATGLGAYIKEYTTSGSFPQIALGISVMCLFVLLLNRFVWRPLYVLAQTRFQLD